MNPKVKRILSAICYFSLFFAPFLFPAVVYFAVQDQGVTYHAKRSFLSHLFPLIAIPLGIIISAETEFNMTAIIISVILFGLTSFAVMVWNIIQGIKVFTR
ncbi:hypothetical protein M1K46_01350 [Fictibacillus sp. WQ 8-8]|uniref:hypothetical protein n=1 Tax=unclassified Fictibacillus TaxID=2644029 RepID=UPI0006A764DD|nr:MULTISPECIES: hypothetical protein [unclassified Fictibacillus]MCQ6264316.1 hypothetical protein [Fictibacillus sp. WQ 8-8]MED2971637.1 hypothetical protein [Fictibacillus sp. B-59209]SFD43871.1 hypothetical protein SAMN05428981_101406 [Bacillus sp. OV194]